jgi:hypothetical protein
VEDKTRTKQIDGGRTNGSFLVQNFFEKKFLPVNSQLGRKSSVFGFLVLYTYYPILDSIIFLVKARLLAWRGNKMYVLLKSQEVIVVLLNAGHPIPILYIIILILSFYHNARQV